MKGSCNVIKESYKHYRFKNERYKVSADYKEYSDIAKVFFKHLFEIIVKTGNEIILPSKMGVFVVEQYNVDKYNQRLLNKNKSIWSKDYVASKQHEDKFGTKEHKLHDNTKTNGRMWSFNWLRSAIGTFRNKSMYSFTLVRSRVRSSSNREYSESSEGLSVHDFFIEQGYKIYRELIRQSFVKANNYDS